MQRNIETLIEGGLPRTMGFAPTENNPSIKDHVQWLEWRLKVAQIPVKKMMWVRSNTPNVFALDCEVCIRTFRERAHNSGLKFTHIKPVFGTSVSCIVEVIADPSL